MAGTTWGLVKATRQEEEARRQAQIARQETAEKEKARQSEAERAEGERLENCGAGRGSGSPQGTEGSNRAGRGERQAKLEAEAKRAEAERQRSRAEVGERLASERLKQVAVEKKKAEEEKQIAQSVRDFLQGKLLGQADSRAQADSLLRSGGLPAEAKENPTIRELLDRAAKELTPERIDANFPTNHWSKRRSCERLAIRIAASESTNGRSVSSIAPQRFIERTSAPTTPIRSRA